MHFTERKYDDYATYIKRIVQSRGQGRIDNEGMQVIQRIINFIQKKMLHTLDLLCANISRQTVRDSDIIHAANTMFTEKLLEKLYVFIEKIVVSYLTFDKEMQEKKRITVTEQASLVFPPSRFRTFTKRKGMHRISDEATVVGAACLEGFLHCLIDIILETTPTGTIREPAVWKACTKPSLKIILNELIPPLYA
jgi:histone H3/H4